MGVEINSAFKGKWVENPVGIVQEAAWRGAGGGRGAVISTSASYSMEISSGSKGERRPRNGPGEDAVW